MAICTWESLQCHCSYTTSLLPQCFIFNNYRDSYYIKTRSRWLLRTLLPPSKTCQRNICVPVPQFRSRRRRIEYTANGRSFQPKLRVPLGLAKWRTIHGGVQGVSSCLCQCPHYILNFLFLGESRSWPTRQFILVKFLTTTGISLIGWMRSARAPGDHVWWHKVSSTQVKLHFGQLLKHSVTNADRHHPQAVFRKSDYRCVKMHRQTWPCLQVQKYVSI